MFQFKSFIQRYVGTTNDDDNSSYPRCDIEPVGVVQSENSTAKRDKALTHLLKLNHHTHSVLYSGYRGFPFHNHVPHLLGTAYLFGANDKQLHDIYEREEDIEPWKDSPSEVTEEDWWQFRGDPNYQRAFLDFFEDELVREGYDWRKVLMEYMLEGETPLINSLICGLAHPLIHFGYAVELNSREVAMEALTLAATSHDFLHKYVETEIPPPTAKSTTDPLLILRRVREDPRFDEVCDNPGQHNDAVLFRDREDVILEYYNQLDFETDNIHPSDPNQLQKILHSLSSTTVLLLTTTHKHSNPQFDFFLAHALNSLYAVRTLLPVLPAKHHTKLLRSHWLFTLFVYLTQMRPSIKPDLLESEGVDKVDVSRGWEYVDKLALEKGLKKEVHFMKALRTMKEFAKLWSKDDNFFLTAATKFAEEFEDWVGFGYAKDTLDIKA